MAASKADAGSEGDGLLLRRMEGGVLTLTMNRPDKRNALSRTVVIGLITALAEASQDADVRVVLLRAAGPDFCAGADLAEMERLAEDAAPMTNLQDAGSLGQLLVLIRRFSKPVVAAVHGHALAGGAGLATACDLVVAREDAVFGYPEVRLGFVPAMVMALLRRSVGEKVAFELVVRGDGIGAEEAAGLGLVNRVVPEQEWDAAVERYAREIADHSSSAVTLIKRLLYGMDGLSFEEAVARGAEVNTLARLTEDTREGLRRFLANRGTE
jgi:methylglutaconyl-CoA hydratase